LSESTPRHRLVSALGYGLYAVAAVWLLLELIGAFGLVSYKDRLTGPRKFSLGFTRVPDRDVRGVTYQDTAYTWGLEADPIPYHFRTDGHGLRNAEHRDAADVYLLGDSFIVGALVPFEETVTGQLEGALGRDAMTVALLSISPQYEHDLMRELELPVEGRTVLQFIFEGNDQKDSHAYRTKRHGDPADRNAKKSQEKRGTLERLWRRSLTRNLFEVLKPADDFSHEIAARTCRIEDQLYTFHYRRAQVKGLDDEIPHLTAALESYATEVRAAGGSYVVAFIPTKLHVLAPLCEFPAESDLREWDEHLGPLREQLVAWGAESGVPMLDLTPALQTAARDGRMPWYWGDTHWNAEGHRVAAETLADWPALRGAVGGD